MTWGGYVMVLYFVVGVMEAWSNPNERLAAIAQILLTVMYFSCLVLLTQGLRQEIRAAKPPAGRE